MSKLDMLRRVGANDGKLLALSATSAGGIAKRDVEAALADELIEIVDHPTTVDRGTGRPAAALRLTERGRALLTSGGNCAARVWNGSVSRSVPCRRAATRDGYCATHHPDAVAKREQRAAARAEAASASFRERMQAHDANRAKLATFDGLVAALREVERIADHEAAAHPLLAVSRMARTAREAIAKADAITKGKA
jgi:hypothetical protein